MKRNIIIAVVIALLILITFFVVDKLNKSSKLVNNPEKSGIKLNEGKLVTGSDIETFSGTITSVDTGCFSDRVCSVTVDGKKVILVKGGRGLSPDTIIGKLIGVESIDALEKRIGDHANVYAGLTPEGDYSIYGNANYYVEVIIEK